MSHHDFKILLLGESGVGKTTIIQCLQGKEFEESITNKPTIGLDFASIRLKSKRELVDDLEILLWDPAGDEKYRPPLISGQIRAANVIFLVYDITKQISFDALISWMKEIYKIPNNDATIVLLGNKSDQIDERVIALSQGSDFAKAHGIEFLETTMTDKETINSFFKTLVYKLEEEKEKKYEASKHLYVQPESSSCSLM